MVEGVEIPKAHASFILWGAQSIPIYPIYFFLIISLSPPILSQHRVNTLTHLWNFENTHRVSGYCLGHRVDQNLPTRLRYWFFLPPNHPFVILSCRSIKVLTLDLYPTIGSLRYFSQLVMTCALNKFWISSLSLWLVFLLKKIVVFCLLMACKWRKT